MNEFLTFCVAQLDNALITQVVGRWFKSRTD